MPTDLSERLEAKFPAAGGFGTPDSTFIFGASYGFPCLGSPQLVTRFYLQQEWVRLGSGQMDGKLPKHAPGPHSALVYGNGDIIVRSYDWLLSAIYVSASVRESDPLWQACALENEAGAIDNLRRADLDVVEDALRWLTPLRPNLASELGR